MIEEKSNNRPSGPPEWVQGVNRYNKPDKLKSIWQIINSLGPYVIMWYLMYLSLEVSYLLTLGLSFVAAAFLVRVFIIFHDCGHGAFFKSEKANRIVGTILGSLVFTPYAHWHRDHAIHHTHVGNLDQRGIGDVLTLTVDEYNQRSLGGKLYYRIYRHPVTLFAIAPIILFVLWFRFPQKKMQRAARISVYVTNLIVALFSTGLILLMIKLQIH